jgi:hypothetical protein
MVDYFRKSRSDAIEFVIVIKECKRMFNLYIYFKNSHIEFDIKEGDKQMRQLIL